MTAPSLVHVGLLQAADRDASERRAGHEPPPPRGGPPRRRVRSAMAALLARGAARLDVDRARRAIA